MQSGNIAFIPLMGTTLSLAIAYAMTAPAYYARVEDPRHMTVRKTANGKTTPKRRKKK